MSYATEVLADSPRLHLRFGEPSGATALDSSGLGHDGTYTGCTLAQAGALASDPDTAVLLDGIDDVVVVVDHADLDLGDGPLSLECWVKHVASGDFHTLVSKGDGAYQLQVGSVFSGGKITLQKQNFGVIVSSTVALADDAAFHHVVATKDGSSAFIYVDGVDVTGTVTDQTLANTAADFNVGRRSGLNDEYFAGTIDEVAVYNTVLSPARVGSHFAVGTVGGPEQTAIWPYNRQGPF